MGSPFKKESIQSIQLAEVLMKFEFSKNGLRIRFSLTSVSVPTVSQQGHETWNKGTIRSKFSIPF